MGGGWDRGWSGMGWGEESLMAITMERKCLRSCCTTLLAPPPFPVCVIVCILGEHVIILAVC